MASRWINWSARCERNDEMPDSLNASQLSRYARHLSMPEVGVDGQLRLARSRVLIIGAGGLGCPAALYLAAAGVGSIGLVDPDLVDLSNLQRQVLFGTGDVGARKVDVAARRLRSANPDVAIETHAERLHGGNAIDLVRGHDVVIDGTDNFPARYAINDACGLVRVPLVHGSIFRFDGMVSVFDPASGAPCYRCLHPEPPGAGQVPGCAEAGVLGVLPGIVGTLQACEAIKLLLGIGEPLRGRVLLVDALSMRFDELRVQRRADCALCGASPTIDRVIDIEPISCGSMSDPTLDARGLPPGYAFNDAMEITPRETKKLLDERTDFVFIDCRLPSEAAITKIDGAQLIPLQQIQQHSEQLMQWKDRKIVVHCKVGGRSMQFAHILKQSGFTDVRSMAGGILLWNKDVNPGGPQY
jgi:sulfur-carrier protein adenylyltransferase/sulfurtransferase